MGNKERLTKTAKAIFGTLQVGFVLLKLFGAISWSWLWVLSPFWIPLAVAATCQVILLICDAAESWGK